MNPIKDNTTTYVLLLDIFPSLPKDPYFLWSYSFYRATSEVVHDAGGRTVADAVAQAQRDPKASWWAPRSLISYLGSTPPTSVPPEASATRDAWASSATPADGVNDDD